LTYKYCTCNINTINAAIAQNINTLVLGLIKYFRTFNSLNKLPKISTAREFNSLQSKFK